VAFALHKNTKMQIYSEVTAVTGLQRDEYLNSYLFKNFLEIFFRFSQN